MSLMKWLKQGKIFSPPSNSWMKSHAQLPTPLLFQGRIRIFFSSRPEPGMSLISYVDVDEKDPSQVIYSHSDPILNLGNSESFDEHGVMPSFAYEKDGKLFLYYTGWSRQKTFPYQNWTGLAVSEDGGKSFEKMGLVIGSKEAGPYSATCLTAVQDSSGEWTGLVTVGRKWIRVQENWEHVYDLAVANSKNGQSWIVNMRAAIPLNSPDECLTRPSLLWMTDRWHLWFCYRGATDFRDGRLAYRIGYAWSRDKVHWNRQDSSLGLECSSSGWDSLMVAYPQVIRTQYGIYLFYNGNGFGREGFGYAKLTGPEV